MRAPPRLGVRPVFKRVDTCAAEFATPTAYMYSTYEEECEARRPTKKIMVLGGGPNRIGQGIEFDYCCVHAALALREDGYETIMVNCNPETVSTDYDTSDRLYFSRSPGRRARDRPNIENRFKKGHHRPVRRPDAAEARAGTEERRADHRHQPDDRRLPRTASASRNCSTTWVSSSRPTGTARRPPSRLCASPAEIGYPLVVRPSYVLGGRADGDRARQKDLERYMREAVKVSNESPVLLDRFLNDANRGGRRRALDDGKQVMIGGIMEHIEQAGVHPATRRVTAALHAERRCRTEMRRPDRGHGASLKVVGLMNVPVRDPGRDNRSARGQSPRLAYRALRVQGRTLPLAKIAARCMAGRTW